MGFHIIIKKEKLDIIHKYVEMLDELAYVSEITDDAVIYQGEAHWKPVVVGKSSLYKDYTKDWFRAGIQAQELFKVQATQRGYILETLNQDQKSFKSYTDQAREIPIKRGDFLIRNAKNMEVDVKCRAFYREAGERYFNFKVEHCERHVNMMGFTNTPIVIAVYERVKDGPKPDQLFMFNLVDFSAQCKDLKIQNVKNVGRCYMVPVALTKKGFQIIEKYQSK